MTAKYTRPRKRRKAGSPPAKPYDDFPLYAHPLGYWSKKIKGKIVHFGRWGRVVKGKLTPVPYEAGCQDALANFEDHKKDGFARLIKGPVAGTAATAKPDGLTLAELCDRFLDTKRNHMEAGEIGQRMYDEYKSITDLLIQQFGRTQLVDDLTAKDFERLRTGMARRWGPVRLTNQITRAKSVFKYAYDMELIENEIRCLRPRSAVFKKPSADVLRRHHTKNGERMLDAAECRKLLEAADGREVAAGFDKKTGKPIKVKLDRNPQLRAMLLLGLNCGFGNHDCATLPLSALDLRAGWVDYPRPKTGIARRCPLWPETIAALQAAIADRPEPKQDDAEELVFVTSRGRPWLSRGIANPVSVAARKLMHDVGVNSRKGLGFYTLRHVFRTVAVDDATHDEVAASAIMGHAPQGGDMSAVYRHHIGDDRLRAVTDHVRNWLFAVK